MFYWLQIINFPDFKCILFLIFLVFLNLKLLNFKYINSDFEIVVGNILLIPLEVQETLCFLELKAHLLVTSHHQKMSLADIQ